MASPRFIHWLPVPAACLALWVLGGMPGGKQQQQGRTARILPGRTARATEGAGTAAEAQRLWALVAEAQTPEEQEAARARFMAYLEPWIAADPRRAADYLESQQLLWQFEEPLVKAWVQRDAASLPASVQTGSIDRRLWWGSAAKWFAQAWMAQDPDAAWAWMNAGDDAAADPEIRTAARREAIGLVARQYQRQGHADAALAWLDTLSHDDERYGAVRAIIPGLSSTAPDKAVQWLAAKPLPESLPVSNTAPVIEFLIKDSLRRWVDRDAAAAGEWINSHRDCPQAPALIGGYAMSIAGEDPAAAREWLAQLPEGTVIGHLNSVGSMRPVKRADLERLIDLAQICALALEDPARGIALAQTAFPGNAAALTHYKIELVRNAPGTPPVPLLTPRDPNLAQACHYSFLSMPTQIMVRGPDGTLTAEPPSAETTALVQAIQAHRAAEAAQPEQAASAAQAQAAQPVTPGP